jgi:hypothetical protein
MNTRNTPVTYSVIKIENGVNSLIVEESDNTVIAWLVSFNSKIGASIVFVIKNNGNNIESISPLRRKNLLN